MIPIIRLTRSIIVGDSNVGGYRRVYTCHEEKVGNWYIRVSHEYTPQRIHFLQWREFKNNGEPPRPTNSTKLIVLCKRDYKIIGLEPYFVDILRSCYSPPTNFSHIYMHCLLNIVRDDYSTLILYKYFLIN